MTATGKPTAPREFGQWLDLTLENSDMTGKQLARLAHLDEAQISRWRRGKAKPSLETCERLADALGVDPQRLAVTAGVMSSRMAGAEALPMPPKTAAVEKARYTFLRDLPGATEGLVEELLDVYKRGIGEETP